MNPTLKKILLVAAKNAVNAGLLSLYPVYQAPAQFNLHTQSGIEHVLGIVGSAVLIREGMIFLPKIIKWSQTDADLNDNGGK